MDTKFKSDHAEMLATARAIVDLVARGTARDDQSLNRFRLRLSRLIANHCAVEGLLLHSPAARALPPAVSARYHDELLDWRRELTLCNSHWPPARVWADRAGFLAAFAPLASALERRIRWEEQEFYPALQLFGVASVMRRQRSVA